MLELFENTDHIALWQQLADGRRVEWSDLFANYRATVDWPSTSFWRELATVYRDAKIILTERDPEGWYKSVRDTIYKVMDSDPPADQPALVAHRDMVRTLVWEGVFDGRLGDKDHAIGVYNAWNANVKETCPPKRLIVFDPAQGWGPLCSFLERPVPDAPYPHTNTTEEFNQRH